MEFRVEKSYTHQIEHKSQRTSKEGSGLEFPATSSKQADTNTITLVPLQVNKTLTKVPLATQLYCLRQ